MSVFENRLKQLFKIAPDMKFNDAMKLAEEFQKNSNDHSEKNYVVLLLLEMIGVDSNGNWPEEFRKKGADNQKFAFAMKHAGLCHGLHSCGIPGYKIAMDEYYQKFIRGNYLIESGITQFQQNLKQTK